MIKVPLIGAAPAIAPVAVVAPANTSATGRVSGGGYLGGNGLTARVVPDGSDDHIIARRLRKAAENEPDPELKRKLWKEYVDYRSGTQK